MNKPKNQSEYRDRLMHTILKAPDGFDSQLNQSLEKSFESLRLGLPTLRNALDDKERLKVLNEMLSISYEAYQRNDLKKGVGVLQEFMGIVWPRYALPRGYELEAKGRVNANAT